ncbi:MAG: aldo/keto reductase [Proteobacteria bacterium]|nr:MAG: aldo/keto reductase [Pseudomonadota bacterium]
MEYRKLLGSGLSVPALTFGTATFGGANEFFKAWGSTDVAEAKELIDLCLDHGVNHFDTANVYSDGMAEEILGKAIQGKRNRALIATKATFQMGDDVNDIGSSRLALVRECENSLKRLGTDYIDIYYMHGFDATTPVEETLRALDDLVRAGKIRYIGCSNFSGWQLMKSLNISERYGWSKYILHQTYYSLMNRELEWELIPASIDQKVSNIIWSPLAGGALSGKIDRQHPPKPGSRSAAMDFVTSTKTDHFYNVVDTLQIIAKEMGKSPAQVAYNWLLKKPTVSSLIIGARNKEQLLENFNAVGWTLPQEFVDRLDEVSDTKPIYPYWHQNKDAALGHPMAKHFARS